MESIVDHDLRERYEQDGFVLVKGALDADRDIGPFVAAYTRLIDAMAYVYLVENGASISDYDSLALPERFATLLGVSGTSALHHLDPVLNSFLPHYKRRHDLPGAQIPALFDFISNPNLLDVVEALIGPEVTASPIYHINFKLAPRHLDLVKQVATEVAGNQLRLNEGATNNPDDDPALERFYAFQVGKTDWHMDAISGLYDSHESNIGNAWIPVTEATEENGCLRVIPGSHRDGVRGAPFADEELDRAISLPTAPGDIIVLHNKLLHSSTLNTSEKDFRWAFNFRYLPTGEPSGRPFLPGFIVRSRSAPDTEFKNPYLWATMWQKALDHLSKNGSPYAYTDLREGKLDLNFARNLTKSWNTRVPNPQDWLSLEG